MVASFVWNCWINEFLDTSAGCFVVSMNIPLLQMKLGILFETYNTLADGWVNNISIDPDANWEKKTCNCKVRFCEGKILSEGGGASLFQWNSVLTEDVRVGCQKWILVNCIIPPKCQGTAQPAYYFLIALLENGLSCANRCWAFNFYKTDIKLELSHHSWS